MSHRRCWCRGASCCSPAADCSRSDCCSSVNGGHRLTGFAICCGKPRCFVVGGGSWLFITLGRVAGGRESQIRVFWKCPQWFKTWLRKKCTRTVLQQLLDNYFQSRLSTRLFNTGCYSHATLCLHFSTHLHGRKFSVTHFSCTWKPQLIWNSKNR